MSPKSRKLASKKSSHRYDSLSLAPPQPRPQGLGTRGPGIPRKVTKSNPPPTLPVAITPPPSHHRRLRGQGEEDRVSDSSGGDEAHLGKEKPPLPSFSRLGRGKDATQAKVSLAEARNSERLDMANRKDAHLIGKYLPSPALSLFLEVVQGPDDYFVPPSWLLDAVTDVAASEVDCTYDYWSVR
jgi:hypothetical protein